MDRTGSVYCSDLDTHRIRKIDATGTITTLAGSGTVDSIRGLFPLGIIEGFSGDGGPAVLARLSAPTGMVADAAGNLFFCDARNNRVRRIDPGGVITTVVGSGPAGLGTGSFSGDGGPATAATLNSPIGIAKDVAGNLFIADRNNARVRRVSPQGIITTVAGGGTDPLVNGAQATAIALRTPSDVAVDRAGNLFISERGLFRILKVSPAGIVTIVAGSGKRGFTDDGGPATDAAIEEPVYIALDRDGNLFWAELNNRRVRKVGPDGILTTVAGSGPIFPAPATFAGDGGPATAARMVAPFSVALDASGNLLVNDQWARRIRKVIGIAAPGLPSGP